MTTLQSSLNMITARLRMVVSDQSVSCSELFRYLTAGRGPAGAGAAQPATWRQQIIWKRGVIILNTCADVRLCLASFEGE